MSGERRRAGVRETAGSPVAGPRGGGGDERARLREFWDGSRDYYELAVETNPEAAPERQRLFGYLEGGERVLDLGSGSCDNALWLPEDCRYVGLDVSTAGLALAAELGRPGARVRGGVEALPFAEASFDAVLSTWVIEHLHDPGSSLLEAARVLRPGGLLLLVGSAWDLPHALPPSLPAGRRWEVALRRLGRQLRSRADGRHRFDVVREPRALSESFVPDADAVHVTQSVAVARFLEAAGLAIVEHASLPHGPPPAGPRGLLRATLRRVAEWRFGWGNLLLVARRGETIEPPAYELLEL